MTYLFTSESVAAGHPDKLCDQISDAILDEFIKKDPSARVACETATTKNAVFVMGEITSNAKVNIEKIVRKTIVDIGYTDESIGINGNTCDITIKLKEQSPDINLAISSPFILLAKFANIFGTMPGNLSITFIVDVIQDYVIS